MEPMVIIPLPSGLLQIGTLISSGIQTSIENFENWTDVTRWQERNKIRLGCFVAKRAVLPIEEDILTAALTGCQYNALLQITGKTPRWLRPVVKRLEKDGLISVSPDVGSKERTVSTLPAGRALLKEISHIREGAI
ncbi:MULTISPECIES: hypothetical protein [unclassified Saccharibacter]|uniref:hypothetical protein n=1 Tax=unclassified Saccharibacter TaxID=2648722 RepID=UPI001326C3E2|nr:MULTISPECIES: hypothetical protein [unclassified Saccharibacter]MXV35944.1 hypothetical protein [Saccharibacter sp. EH611]MXV58378.1 hypothetical protein [Saccharibacter sp. EH70]MXV65834.1 hypothetical protein [Saccharibacter sp. EH60]